MSLSSPGNSNEGSIFENEHDKEVLLDNWKYGSRKTMKAIFFIAGIFLLSDLLALSRANVLNTSNIIYVLFVPMIYVGLGFLAKTKPLVAIIIATILFVAIIILSILTFGGSSIISGLLLKAIIIYYIFSGISNAKDAEEARKKLALYR